MPTSLSATDVVSQVAMKLLDGFKNEITTVYKDTPLEGMVKPCFFIQQLNTTHVKGLRNSGERIYFLDVRCHPNDKEDTKQTYCNAVGHKLFEVLDNITISGKRVTASNMRFEIMDNVLHFFVEYSFRVNKMGESIDKMRTLETEGFISYGKGGN